MPKYSFSKDAPGHKGMLARIEEKEAEEKAKKEAAEKEQLMQEALNDPAFKA
jgi:hypothetical protein